MISSYFSEMALIPRAGGMQCHRLISGVGWPFSPLRRFRSMWGIIAPLNVPTPGLRRGFG